MDRIEKRVKLRVPVARVWRALVDAEEFSRWFGVKLDGPFVAGRAVRGIFDEGALPPADAIARMQAGLGLEPSPIRKPPPQVAFCVVERIEPERLFSFRWIPYGIDASIEDYAKEPMTLVEFHLESVDGGTQLTIVESGFDEVPAHRRARAFRMNEHGWAQQAENLARHVEK